MPQKSNPYPDEILESLVQNLIKSQPQVTDCLELVVSIAEVDLNLRDLSGYLDLADRVYGRLVTDGLRSYAQLPSKQIRITEVRSGSFEMVFQEMLANMDKVSATVLVGLLLKYLPAAFESLSAAYKDYQEAQLTKLRREKLRQEMEKDQDLKNLDYHGLDLLVAYLDQTYQSEKRTLPSACRFAEKYVQKISFSLVRKTE